jgi:hypothetical protein
MMLPLLGPRHGKNNTASSRNIDHSIILALPPKKQNVTDNFPARLGYFRLKYCTALSCFLAALSVLNVPRFLRFPVLGFFFREYNR